MSFVKTEANTKIEKLNFHINIKASVEKVYKIVTEKESYQDWVSSFSPNTSNNGNWIEANTITFFLT